MVLLLAPEASAGADNLSSYMFFLLQYLRQPPPFRKGMCLGCFPLPIPQVLEHIFFLTESGFQLNQLILQFLNGDA